MKTKNITILLVAACFCACRKDKPIEPEVFNFDCSRYPITGYSEFKDANVPANVLDTISTDRLLLSSLYYETYFINLSSSGGVLIPIYNKFEGLAFTSELFKRENVHYYIYERYLCVGTENFDFTFLPSYNFSHLELFLLYQPVFSKFNGEEKMEILNKAIETYESRFVNNDEYSATSVIIIGQILSDFNYKPYQEFRDGKENSHFFLDYGMTDSISEEDLDIIIDLAKDFINNN